MSFKHLNIIERESIFLWLNLGVSNREIAKRLGRDHKGIDKEIQINTKYGKKYSPHLAQKRAERVSRRQRYKAPLKGPEIFLFVREHLRSPHFWTPETISGRIGEEVKGVSISVETIYRYIYSNQARKYSLWKHLTCKREKRMKKHGRKVKSSSKIPNAVSIDKRAKYILKRKQLGHWESDLIEGPRSSKHVLSVTTERSTRYIIINKLSNKKTEAKTKHIVDRMGKLPAHLLRSLTVDNGAENTNHTYLTQQLNISVYFCHPYHSWEKGTVENRNKVIRRFFPKGTDFSKIPAENIRFVELVINNMPLKCLQFKTPNEKMSQLMSKLKLT